MSFGEVMQVVMIVAAFIMALYGVLGTFGLIFTNFFLRPKVKTEDKSFLNKIALVQVGMVVFLFGVASLLWVYRDFFIE